MSNSAFTPAVLTVSSGTGSGSGEKNYITNPSMASATTGWNVVGDFTLTRTTAASELPREYTTGTGIKLVATSGTQSTADYMYFDFNLDDVDLGKKLKIQWSQKKIGTYSAGQLAVVITTQADRTTALITPQTTAIPASDLDFVTSFDSTTTAALSLVIRATTDMTTGDGIVISDVIVGPGEIVQGAVVSEWQSYTPTVSTGTWTNNRGYYRRVGSSLELRIYAGPLTANGSGLYTWALPSGLTADLTALGASGITPSIVDTDGGSNTIIQVGTATINSQGGTWYMDGISPSALNDTRAALASTTTIAIIGGSGTAANRADALGSVNNGSSVSLTAQIEARIPIAEWAGSGTVNLGPGAQVEYLSTSFSSFVADRSPAGTVLPTTTPASTSETISCGSQPWQYTTQSGDTFELQVKVGTGSEPWMPIPNAYIDSLRTDGTNYIGLGFYYDQTSNAFLVIRGKYRAGTTTQWSNLSGVLETRYRIVKSKASSPVGFGLADSSNSGLIKPRKGQQSLTVTATNWTTTRAVGIYYQDQDGNHRLKFNIQGISSVTVNANATYTLTIAGVTFKNLINLYQTLSVQCVGTVPYLGSANANYNAGTINIFPATNSTDFRVAGDVELESKPTWA